MLKRVLPLFFLPAFLLSACTGSASAAGSQPRILPLDCRLNAGDSISLSLDGVLPQNAALRWDASAGSIVSTGQGLNSVYTAPDSSTNVVISLYISSGTPGGSTQPITRDCTVTAPAPTPSAWNPPIQAAVSPPTPNGYPVIISEVMANPCGGDEFRKWNEYVELYNNGDQPLDVGGWWLTVTGPDNKSDTLVAWETRNPNLSINQPVITNSTVIPAHSFAVVLSPIYMQSLDPYRMPYRFPAGTTLLTIAEGDRIGHKIFGIIGQGSGRDVVVLYLGGAKSIRQVISSYGSPLLARYVQDIRDDHADVLPLDLHSCGSAERVNPLGPDTFDNWHEVMNGSPGEAPYP